MIYIHDMTSVIALRNETTIHGSAEIGLGHNSGMDQPYSNIIS
jgi:hypothetical protein